MRPSHCRDTKQAGPFLISSPRISGSRRHSSLAFAFIHRAEGHPKRENVALRAAGWTGNKAEGKGGKNEQPRRASERKREREGGGKAKGRRVGREGRKMDFR